MLRFVSYVTDEAIEKNAQALLAEFAQARGVVIEPPIPIEDIIEKHLKIGIEFDDMHRLFNVPRRPLVFEPDILGAIFFHQRRIVIDENLDPDANPSKEGRYRFTLAHEAGHDRLHRGLTGKVSAETAVLNANAPPSVICRSSQAKARIELQADNFAACLLMPRDMVASAWATKFGDSLPRVLKPLGPVEHRFVEIAREHAGDGQPPAKNEEDFILERIADPFAKTFGVSPVAMRIRLERMGLLFRELPEPWRSHGGA